MNMRALNEISDKLERIKDETMRERALDKGSLAARITVHLGTCGRRSGRGDR